MPSPVILRRLVLAAAIATWLELPFSAPHLGAQQPVRRAPAATPASTDAASLTPAMKREVVDSLASQLARHYIEADTGRLIGEHVRKRLAAGAYDGITSPQRFAEVLGEDLRKVNNDLHLFVRYNPGARAMRVGSEGIRMLGGPGGPPPTPEMVAAARRQLGLSRVEILPGNVGYLEIRGFSGAPEAQEAALAALKYLQYTDAMIVDLRRNGGGSAELVNFIISHFTGPDTVASLTVKNRSGNESFTRYTLASVPGPRRPDVPLYVLTSRFTASAGEDFAFVLKNLGRATIVGDRTAGAGRNNAVVDIGYGFGASVSFTRVSDPKTGAEWEAVGVQPTVNIDQARALDAAHSLALKAIVDREQNANRRRALELVREVIDARGTAKAVPAATLAQFAGTYESGWRFEVVDGALHYAQRPGQPTEPLVPLGTDRFGDNAMRFAFEREGGRVVRLRVSFPDGRSSTYARDK